MAKYKDDRYVLSINTASSSAFIAYFRNRVKAEQRAAYEKILQREIWTPYDGARVVVLDTVTNKLIYNMPVHRTVSYHKLRPNLNDLRSSVNDTLIRHWKCIFTDPNNHDCCTKQIFESPTDGLVIFIIICRFTRLSKHAGQIKSISTQWSRTGKTNELTRADLEMLVKDFESGNFR